MKKLRLTPKQELFVNKYIELGNGSEAYRLAYPKSKLDNKKITVQVQKLFKNPRIALVIKELQENLQMKHNITIDKVIQDIELARKIACGIEPHKVIVYENGKQVIKELQKTDLTAFIKLTELQMKHLGMFEKDNKQKKTDINLPKGFIVNGN